MKKPVVAALSGLACMVVSGSCFAHAGHVHGSSFSAGFMHPLTGLDHLFALLLIGIFAGTCTRQIATKLTAFVCGALLVGFIAGVGLTQVDKIELLVSMSMILLPVSILVYHVVNALKLMVIVMMGVFAICHGVVQGAEAHGLLIQYGLGTVVASFSVITLTALVVYIAKAQVRKMAL